MTQVLSETQIYADFLVFFKTLILEFIMFYFNNLRKSALPKASALSAFQQFYTIWHGFFVVNLVSLF